MTAKKLAACRQNAQASTGPRTPEGKTASAANSRKHGFTAKTLHIPPEQQEVFDRHHAALHRDIHPETAPELDLFEQLLHSSWMLHLIHQAELHLAISPESLLDPGTAAQLDRLDRYRARHQRDDRATLKLLRDLQTDRATIAQQDPLVRSMAGGAFPMARFSHLTKRTDRLMSANLMKHIRAFMADQLEEWGIDPETEVDAADKADQHV